MCGIQVHGCETDSPTQRTALKRKFEAVTKKQTQAATKNEQGRKVKGPSMSQLKYQTNDEDEGEKKEKKYKSLNLRTIQRDSVP